LHSLAHVLSLVATQLGPQIETVNVLIITSKNIIIRSKVTKITNRSGISWRQGVGWQVPSARFFENHFGQAETHFWVNGS
jgi:hypothetical protein